MVVEKEMVQRCALHPELEMGPYMPSNDQRSDELLKCVIEKEVIGNP